MKSDNRMKILVYSAMLVFYILLFRVICMSGLSADDMWNSNLWASRYTGQDTAWDVTKSQFLIWLHMGRFFPVSNLAPFIYMLCPTVLAYKCAIVLATYLDNLVCSLCIRAMTGSHESAYLYMLLFPVLIQLTPEYDSGLYCYHMLIQTVVLFCFLSLYGLVRYIDTKKYRYAVLSAISFFLALGTYEVAYVFIIVLILVAYRKTGSIRTTVRVGLADGIVFAVMCLVNVIVRLFLKTGTYDGISISFDMKQILITLMKQCFTCIPLGRYLCAWLKECYPYSNVYSYEWMDIIRQITIWDGVTILVFLGLLVWVVQGVAKKEDKQSAGNRILLIACGLLIWLLPGCLIAISSKYQQLIGWCAGHLPAYMQSIGFTMLVTGICLLLRDHMRSRGAQRAFTGICGILASGILLLSQVSAREAVEYMNTYRKYPQENIEAASEAGVFDSFEHREDKILVGTTAYVYDNNCSRQFYAKIAQKDIYATQRQDFFAEITTGAYSDVTETEKNSDGVLHHWKAYELEDMEQEYYGVFNMANKTSGALIVGKCIEIDVDASSGEVGHFWIENPTIFIRADGKSMTQVDTTDWELVLSGDGYEIYSMEGRCDIWQEDSYYSSEAEVGILYR